MIKATNIRVTGFEMAVRGMRNPMNSWDKSDSLFIYENYSIGKNDLDLMQKLFRGGTEHRKFLRMIHVQMDVVAPLYWWREFSTYKVGVTVNSCSTMHKIASRPLTMDDFSTDHLEPYEFRALENLILTLNANIESYVAHGDKKDWWQIIQLLPQSYNQRRTIDMNYENVFTIIKQREGHKLDEWNDFVSRLKNLPCVKEIGELEK